MDELELFPSAVEPDGIGHAKGDEGRMPTFS